MTTITPNSGGDTTIEAAPLVDTSILDASAASDGFGDVTVIPSTSASDFVVTTDPYAPVSSVTTTRGVDTFDAFEAAAAAIQPIDPYERYRSFERREKRRRSRSVQNADPTVFVDSTGASAALQTSHNAVVLEHARPRATSTVIRPASVQRMYDDGRHAYNRARVPVVTVTQPVHSAAPQNVVDTDLGAAVHVQPPTRTVTSSTPLMAAPLPHVNPRVLSVPNLTITTPQNPAEVGLMKELRDLLRDPRSVSRVRDVVRRSRAPSAVSRGTKHTATPARAHS